MTISNSHRSLLIAVLLTCTACSRGAEPDATKHEHTNRLAKETSLYLRMHAHNPVDWFPWGKEAFDKAKQENKLIFLSVGYSSCYWCHVMERESFMDDEIAKLLNDNFVCVKVDREERPDVDAIYMTAVQIRSGRGGWPMSVFMTPEGKPFFGGTYFPARTGDRGPRSPGFLDITKSVLKVWSAETAAVKQDADKITELVQQEMSAATVPTPITEALFASVRTAFQSTFDTKYGGFGFSQANPNQPKFPEPSNLLFLVDLARRGDPLAKEMLLTTVERMHMGGIWDHIGGGFHRYSTDRFWKIPHFEKMLYDNGQLLTVYSQCFDLTHRRDFQRVVERIVEYMNRELKAPGGAYFAAMDAESEQVEGKFYRWTPEEVKSVLGNDYAFHAEIFGIDGPPNFEHDFHVPLLASPLPDVAKANGISEPELYAKLDRLNAKLLAAREKRPRPLTDNKILASWNGLAIRGLADAGHILQQQESTESAIAAANFVLRELMTPDGRMLRTYTDGKASLNAYLDDYAFVANGLIALHKSTGNDKWLDAASNLTAKQIELFWDDKNGSFFFTSSDHEALIARTKTYTDNVQPSGNSVAAENLVYLAEKLNKPDYRQMAKTIAESGASFMSRVPTYAPRLLLLGREFVTAP